MEKLYMKFREELENGEILNPNNPSLEECIEEFERLGYEHSDKRLRGFGLLKGYEEGEYLTTCFLEEEIIRDGYKEHFLTPQYREVYVSDVSVEDALENKIRKILITELPGNPGYKYICVREPYEQKFKDGEEYIANRWKYIAEIPKEEPVKEMTLSELEKELGYPIKIIK